MALKLAGDVVHVLAVEVDLSNEVHVYKDLDDKVDADNVEDNKDVEEEVFFLLAMPM